MNSSVALSSLPLEALPVTLISRGDLYLLFHCTKWRLTAKINPGIDSVVAGVTDIFSGGRTTGRI
jgi:hypothetical protein